jgi:DegV family protein with EDD domain
VLPPTVEEFQETFKRLGERCDEIVVLLISSHLNPAITNANNAAESFLGRVKIHIVDSQTTSVGLGLLTQVAAKAASEGLSGVEIIRTVRGVMPHIYALFCIPGLTYLHYAGFLGIAQALVGEKLAVITLFVMENGQLIPVQKARSSRHLVDCLHEFVCEFGNIQHIAVMQGVPPFEQEVRSLRERFSVDFDSGLISEHKISPALGSLIGPRSLGIFVMDR